MTQDLDGFEPLISWLGYRRIKHFATGALNTMHQTLCIKHYDLEKNMSFFYEPLISWLRYRRIKHYATGALNTMH